MSRSKYYHATSASVKELGAIAEELHLRKFECHVPFRVSAAFGGTHRVVERPIERFAVGYHMLKLFAALREVETAYEHVKGRPYTFDTQPEEVVREVKRLSELFRGVDMMPG